MQGKLLDLVITNVPIHNSGMINAYIRNCGTFFMPCIFGFGFHNWFCACELLYVRPSDLNKLICAKCESKFRSKYEMFLNDEKENWDGDFQDFLAIHIDERLKNIRMKYPESCEYRLTIKQYEVVDRKLCNMYDNFISSEDNRIEAKIASGQISIEDLASI